MNTNVLSVPLSNWASLTKLFLHFLISSFTDKEFEQTSKTDENTMTKAVIKVKLWDFWVMAKVLHLLYTLIKHNYTLVPFTTTCGWGWCDSAAVSQSLYWSCTMHLQKKRLEAHLERVSITFLFSLKSSVHVCSLGTAPWNLHDAIFDSLVWAFHHW